jgi:hypothetical protein
MAAKAPLPGGILDWAVSNLNTLGESKPGTGLALVPFGQSEAQIDEVRLFFQRPSGDLVMAGWDQDNDWQISKRSHLTLQITFPLYLRITTPLKETRDAINNSLILRAKPYLQPAARGDPSCNFLSFQQLK